MISIGEQNDPKKVGKWEEIGPHMFDYAICLFLLTAKRCAIVFQHHFTIGIGEAFWAHANVILTTFFTSASGPTAL